MFGEENIPYCCAAKSTIKLTGATHFAVLYDMPMLAVVWTDCWKVYGKWKDKKDSQYCMKVIFKSYEHCIEGSIAVLGSDDLIRRRMR